MPEIPSPLDLDLTTTPYGTKTAVETLLQQKYNSAIDWAQYAATQLQDQLGNLNTALSETELRAALVTLKDTLTAIPAYEPTGNVNPYVAQGPIEFTPAGPYVPPDAQVYGTYDEVPPEIDFPPPTTEVPVDPYVAPTIPPAATVIATLETPVAVDRGTLAGEQPTFLDVPALAAITTPDAPNFLSVPEIVTITTPTAPVLLDIPQPLAAVMPDDPTLGVFTDMADVSSKLETYHNSFMAMLASINAKEDLVGVSEQVTTMLNREQAVADAVLNRLSNQLSTTISTITSQFAARGFDMPPGALLSLTTEANTQAQYALADATAQIGREMISIEGQIITTGMSTNASLKSSTLSSLGSLFGQWANVYNAYFDRGLKYVMDQANNSLEVFKAKVQAQLTLIDANKGYIQATAQYNDANTAIFTSGNQVNLGLLGTNKEQISATSSFNAASEAVFSGQMKVNSDILGVNREQIVSTTTINSSLQEQFADKMKVLLSLMAQDITIGTNAATMNKAKTDTHLSELEIITGSDKAQIATIGGQLDTNSKIRQRDIVEAQYTAQTLQGHLDTIASKYKLVLQENEGKFNVYDQTSRGKMLDIQGQIELLKGQVIAGEYNIKDAYNLFTSLLEIEKMKQVDGEQQIKRAAVLADLANMATRIDIEYAGKELQAELEAARGMAGAFQQMIASSLNGVSASVSEGWSGSTGTSTRTDNEGQTTYIRDADGNVTEMNYNPDVVAP